MGNLVQSSSKVELEKQFKIVKEGYHDITLLQELETGNEYGLKCYTFNSVEGLEACVEKMNFKKRVSHQHLLGIQNVYSRSENTFCSNIHKVFVVIEYPFRTLNEEIEERRRGWDYFSESEVWSILYSCAMGMNYLYSTNLTHEALTSSRIFIEKGGLIKIADPALMAHNSNSISYLTKSNNQHVYLSPEQIAHLAISQPKDYCAQSSDVFVLGLVILEAIHLQGMQDVYDSGVNYRNLAGRIAAIGDRYTSKLRSILQKMLTNRAQDRITFQGIEIVIDEDNFEEDDSRLSAAQSSRREVCVDKSRKPLDSIPSDSNLNLPKRTDEMRPSKTPVLKQEVQGRYNVPVFEPTHRHMSQTPTHKATHQTQIGTPLQKYSHYTIPNKFQDPTIQGRPISAYQPLHIPKYQPLSFPQISHPQALAPLHLSQPYDHSAQNQNLNQNYNLNYNSNRRQITRDQYATFVVAPKSLSPSLSSSGHIPNFNSIQPFRVYSPHPMPRFPTFPSLPPSSSFVKQPPSIPAAYSTEYSYSSLPPKTVSRDLNNEPFQASPVQRLKTQDQLNELQDNPNPQQHNSTIVEITQTELSATSSPSKQEPRASDMAKQKLQYVNEDSDSGSRYQGYKLNGLKHGFGRFYYQDGGYYEGEWRNNKMNGFAKLYYQTGDIAYEGYWVNDKLHGKGKVFNDNPKDLDSSFDYKDFTSLDDHWLFYDGEFAMDAKQGFGTIKLTNGQIFQGEFDKDVIEGKGKFYALSGKVVGGLWKENKLVETNCP